MMTAHVEEEAVMILGTHAGLNRLGHAYRAVCNDHQPTWRGDPHLIGAESAPNFTALCDVAEHNETEHGITA